MILEIKFPPPPSILKSPEMQRHSLSRGLLRSLTSEVTAESIEERRRHRTEMLREENKDSAFITYTNHFPYLLDEEGKRHGQIN